MVHEKRGDRRVAYTKTVLREALVSLMQHQNISSVTVKSICELADVNRSTFYLHYHDQYDLLHQIEQEVLETLGQRLQESQNDPQSKSANNSELDFGWPISIEAITEILQYAQENAALARVLLGENCDFAFHQDIMELSRISILWMDPSIDIRVKDYIIVFGINGCIALAEKWLREGTPEQPDEIARLMLGTLYHGTSSFAMK